MISPVTSSQLRGTGVLGVGCLCCVHVFMCESMCYFAHLSAFGFVCEYCRTLSGMHRSVCKCLLLKQTRHLSPTGPELRYHTPWNLKPDAGSWAAIVIRGTHHAGSVTVWLRCPIRHSIAQPQPTPAWADTQVTAPSLVWSQGAQRPL